MVGVERCVLRGWYREGKAEGEIATEERHDRRGIRGEEAQFLNRTARNIDPAFLQDGSERAHRLTNLPRERTRSKPRSVELRLRGERSGSVGPGNTIELGN